MTDDIDMKALSGSAGDKAARALAAGCDVVLDCWARMTEMHDIAERTDTLTEAARTRLDRAMSGRGVADDTPIEELLAKRDALLEMVRG
jgi:beta-N-acetylhexosaminidase